MRTTKNHTEKRTYIQPYLESIKLDNEISLALTSGQNTPPVAPGESSAMAPELLSNDPFMRNFG